MGALFRRVVMETLCEGQLCMAGRDQETTKANELSFKRGDLITIISPTTEDSEHCLGSTADGLIGQLSLLALKHREPIPMLPMPWFHSNISRLEAEKLLDRNQDGQFLLRTSQHTEGVYALAVSFKGAVQHYLVAMDFKTRQVTLNGQQCFNNLPALVEHYKRPSPELCCVLTVPIIKRSTLEFFIDQEELKKNWGIPGSEVELLEDMETLGQGEFGEVRVATYRGTQVAVKYIHPGKQSAVAVSSFLKEATIFTHLRHKNLVQLVGVVFQGSAIQSVVMELMGKGSLQKYLISRGRSVLTQAELLSFARDVCEGMVYISSKGYVHRDLAARNVLLNSNGQAKISDFGLLRKGNIHVPHEGGKFPVKWTAPEALKESRFTVQSDIWSFGVLLWEVFSYGRTPYPSVPADEVLEMLEDGILMDPPDNCPDPMYSLMCRCWRLEPGDRPSFLVIQRALARSLEEAHTPLSSPVPIRRLPALPDVKVNDLVNSEAADHSYQEAPHKRKLTLLLGNIVFTGPLSSGKTSLIRSLTGEPFRLTEPSTHLIAIGEGYHSLTDTLDWTSSPSGPMYEDELVRIIVEDLLKQTLSKPSMSNGMAKLKPPPSFMTTPPNSTPPPLPPRRVQSFSEAHNRSTLTSSTELASNRFSGSYETIDSNSLSRQPVVTNSPKLNAIVRNRKHLLGKLLSSSFKAKGHARSTEVRRALSDSFHREHQVQQSPAPTDTPTPTYQSSIPEGLIKKIKAGLQEYSRGGVPIKHMGRIVDTPGHPAFSALKQLLITDNSLVVLTFDVSRDIMAPLSPTPQRRNSINGLPSSYYQPTGAKYPKQSYLGQIMLEIGDVCLQWSNSQADMTLCGPHIVMVATHSDKVPSSISHRNFELLQDAVRASPYKKYVSLLKFILSNSSIIERSSVDDLKHFMMELVKKVCRQQIPLKWLRCVRRFQGLSKKGTYFLSLTEARKVISQICDISEEEEITQALQFLHHNLLILHFPRLHHLRELIITDPSWFANKISEVFSASFVDLAAEGSPSELVADQEQLRSKGVLSSQLLAFVWHEKSSRIHHEELLTIMHKMDLVVCLGPDGYPLPSAITVGDLTNNRPHKNHLSTMPTVMVPGLVEERKPLHLSTLPLFKVEPIIFRFNASHIPSGLFSRLLVRCVQSYPSNYCIYQNGATFEVDNICLLMISLESDHFKISLHKIRSSTASEALPSSMDVTDLDSLMSDPHTPNPDICLAVLMFVRATLTDLVQQWMPHLDFDLCISCDCPAHFEEEGDQTDESQELLSRKRSVCSTGSRPRSPGDRHFIILNDVESSTHRPLKCELGTVVQSMTSLSCWFGEPPTNMFNTNSPTDDIGDLVTDSDLSLVMGVLGKSWRELGQTLGFTPKELQRFSLSSDSVTQAGERMLKKWQTLHEKTATFFNLLGALEIVQRRDIADELVAARMADDGISL